MRPLNDECKYLGCDCWACRRERRRRRVEGVVCAMLAGLIASGVALAVIASMGGLSCLGR